MATATSPYVDLNKQVITAMDGLTALKSNPQEPDQRLGTVGTVLVKGAQLVNKGLDFGAEKACNLIEYEGNRQKEKMGDAVDQDAKVNSALKYGIKGVGYATYATVKVSGFVAKKIEKPISGAVIGSVEVVQHKYGGEAGEVYGEAMTAAGNGAMTYMNVASLGVKGLVKKTAKQTAKGVGKGVLETYGEKKMAQADAAANGNKE